VKLVSICCFLVCINLSACRPFELEATVMNGRMQPIANATVTIKRTSNSTHSNSKGKVHMLNLCYDDTLVVRAEGYKTYEEEYEWRRGKQVFILEPQ